MNLNFIEAMELCINGAKISRTGWSNNGYYIRYSREFERFEYCNQFDEDFMCPLSEKPVDSKSVTTTDWVSYT